MNTRILSLPILLTLGLLLAACGTETGALGDGNADGESPGLERPDDDDGYLDKGDGGDQSIEWTRVEPRFDITDGRWSYINEVVVDPDDDSVLLIRFFGGIPECYGAYATVISQSPEEILVELKVGSVPYVGEPPVCIDIAMAQEIVLPLHAPAGDAELRQADPDAHLAYIGLSTADAIALAEGDSRLWRIASEDGESFALTMDYRPDRVNFEIEAGVVVGAWMG